MDLEIDSELEKAKKISRDLTGPVYEVDAVNHFKEVVLHAEAIRNLQGPVYEADRYVSAKQKTQSLCFLIYLLFFRNHHFQQLMMHAHDMKELKGPVYDCDKNHKFQQLVMHAHELKNLMLPVYGVEGKSGYQPPIDKKEVVMPINGN